MTRPHFHPCSTCPSVVPCHGEWERNYDGFPEAICPNYHLPNGEVAELQCEECLERKHLPLGHTECGKCGLVSALYESWPSCTECSEVVCPACESPLHRVEDSGHARTWCKECAAEAITGAELLEQSQRKALQKLMSVVRGNAS